MAFSNLPSSCFDPFYNFPPHTLDVWWRSSSQFILQTQGFWLLRTHFETRRQHLSETRACDASIDANEHRVPCRTPICPYLCANFFHATFITHVTFDHIDKHASRSIWKLYRYQYQRMITIQPCFVPIFGIVMWVLRMLFAETNTDNGFCGAPQHTEGRIFQSHWLA